MNSRDIINALLRDKKAPRMGLFDRMWPETTHTWLAEGYPADPATGRPESPVAHFGFDMEEVGGWFDFLPKQGVAEVVQETEEWQIVRNGAGASLKTWKHKSGTPEHMDFLMDCREVWEAEYRPLLRPDIGRLNVEKDKAALASARERDVWGFFGHYGIWEMMRECVGDLCLYESLLLDPDWILDFNRVYTDFYKAQYKMAFEVVGKPDGIWIFDDLAYNKGTFCAPALLEELYFPFYMELADFFHGHGLPVVFHCCGNMDDVVPLVARAGYDAINPMERKAGSDPLVYARAYKDRLAFIGGLNAVTLEQGNMDTILAESHALIEGMREIGAAFIFASDHSISPQIRYADFAHTVDFFKANADY